LGTDILSYTAWKLILETLFLVGCTFDWRKLFNTMDVVSHDL